MDLMKMPLTAAEAKKAARNVAGIVERAMEINLAGKGEVFVEIQPHVGIVSAEYYRHGWRGSRTRDDWKAEASYESDLGEIRKRLEGIR